MAVVDGGTKKRFVRRFRRRQQGALEFSQQADQKIDRLLLRRLDRLVSVRRFVLLWIGLFAVLFFATFAQFRGLSRYYQSLQPVPGGIYSEGLVGSFTNANPLYASGAADVEISRLVFSGLLKYDKNNVLVGDLAQNYTLDKKQKNYTVHLRKNVTWHDGKPFTADDVVFTYKTIQTLGAQSALYSSWRDIEVTKIDDYTVNFNLPNSLSSFPYALTNGIVPEHLLKDIPPEQLRSASFNAKPIGTGPFVWRFVEVAGINPNERQQRITLSAFSKYWSGRPKLDGFNLLTFSREEQLINSFQKKQINAISGLTSLPKELKKDNSVQTYVTPLSSAVMVFFNNDRPILNDVEVRKALVSAVDRKQLHQLGPYPVIAVDEPLLRGQIGYNQSLTELPYNLSNARKLLEKDGWKLNSSGQRVKGKQALTYDMSSQDTPDYTRTAKFLQEQWDKIGVKVNIHYYGGDELQSGIIANHDYDALLYGISIGVDPDVFAFWDSSQASVSSQGHLNLSEYKSASADQALQAGRTRADANLRRIKYKSFLSAWRNDAPALSLYQPNFIYITRGSLYNYQHKALNSSADRFYNVADWEIRQKHQTNN